MNDRVRASIQRMKARKLGLAKLMFLRADCRGLSLEAAERAWEVLSEDARRKLVRYADAAMSGLSVNYSMPLGCDRFSTETPPPAAGQESPELVERLKGLAAEGALIHTFSWGLVVSLLSDAATALSALEKERDALKALVGRMVEGLEEVTGSTDGFFTVAMPSAMRHRLASLLSEAKGEGER